MGCRVVELGFVKPEYFSSGEVEKITNGDLEGFDYVSLHAPAGKADYGRNQETEEIFERISHIHKKRALDLVIFHPDRISDFSVFFGGGLIFP